MLFPPVLPVAPGGAPPFSSGGRLGGVAPKKILAAPNPAGFKHWRLDGYYRHAILAAVIVGFACKKTQRLWARERGHGLPPSIESVALRKLTLLHRSRSLSDLRMPPGNRLESLRADRKGQLAFA